MNEQTIGGDIKNVVKNTGNHLQGGFGRFIAFIREQGVIGLAIGFLLGGAVSKTVSSFVDNVINPLLGFALGKVDLSDKALTIGSTTLKYGAFISSIVDFIIVAAVVYFVFKGLKLDRIDKKKEA